MTPGGDLVERIGLTALAMVARAQISGCAGIARGVTEAVIAQDEDQPDTRKCLVRGRAFDGLQSYFERPRGASPATEGQPGATLKVFYIHGIGHHEPGHGTQLAENLAHSLALDSTDEHFKQFGLSHPSYPKEELGTLRVSRYFNRAATRAMVFYELTWSEISDPRKQVLSYDNSGEYSFRRATVNNMLKLFINNYMADPMVFLGDAREPILISVGQSLCWMMLGDYQDLPTTGKAFCDAEVRGGGLNNDNDHAFISHSMGSRVMLDALQRLVTLIAERKQYDDLTTRLQETRFTVFMLSNQLPLLQLGLPLPEVRVIAFSDPNDVLSYALPGDFADQYMDSRLCPSVGNVILNVAPVGNVFGGVDFANPYRAHTGYDNDDRVIALITRGIGRQGTDPIVVERCEWIEAK
jgi:hypothetical protein